MNRAGLAVLATSLASLVPCPAAATRPAADDTACGMDLTSVAAAITIRNYPAAEQNMARAMKSCAAPYPGREDLAERLGTLADIQLHQSRWAAGLETTDRCIAAHPPAADCHFYRWFALLKLGRAGEAAAERPVAQAAMEAFLKQEPPAGASEADRKNLETSRSNVRGLLDVLTRAPK